MVSFFGGTWQEALKKSSEDKRLIFLNISTSWCSWCKKLKQQVFHDKKVGIYFNNNFINVELDGDKGEGKRIAGKFGVSNYPALFIMNSDEIPLISSEGFQNSEDLLKMVESVK